MGQADSSLRFGMTGVFYHSAFFFFMGSADCSRSALTALTNILSVLCVFSVFSVVKKSAFISSISVISVLFSTARDSG